jgi:uncharacterized DUF497 family protein
MFSVLALAMLWTQETQAGGASTGCGVAACLTSRNERYTFCIAMRFEWDSEKNRINQEKHGGIAFESAALVFDDPHVIFRKDRIVTGEQRWHAIAAAEGAVLLVVHVSRMEHENGEEETIRIISAREANKRERRIYIQQAGE